MLRDELLRSKNDEIARCLLSRKRKLSELYFATVGFAGATENAPTNALYHQKEQTFLDANDLSKGRYFNEATLPPFPDFAALIPRPEEQQTSPDVIDAVVQTHDVSSVNAPSKAEGAVRGIAPGFQQREGQTAQVIEQRLVEDSLKKDDARIHQQPALAVTSEITQVDKSPATSAQPDQLPQKASLPVLESPPTSTSHESVDVCVSPALKEQPPGEVAPPRAASNQLPSAQRKPESRPSLVLAQSLEDQPLSPVSSAGPYSNNTPVPVAVSPDTSPAEEVTEGADQVARSPKHVGPVQLQPSLVPSTPDEQLQLEAAQSLQQSTLASKSIGDVTTASSLSNEVIKEDVGPTPSAAVDPLKEKEDQTSASVVPPEPKRPDGVVVTPEEPQPPSQRIQEETQPQVGAEVKVVAPTTPAGKKPTAAAMIPAQPERMTTRVSSGAIRHKSVSEILGETPKPSVVQPEKAHPMEKPTDMVRAPPSASPESAAKMRLKDRKAREKERSKLSTVVFPKQQQQQQQQQEKDDSLDIVRQYAGELARLNEEQDYLFTLFQNKAYAPPRGTNLSTLLASAHKTLTTSNHLLEYQEQMDCRTLRRIYALQNANRWPLRQLKRSVEPPRQGTHWDVLLDHMKWMRTDFREERKWKIAAAKSCADWCAEYVNSDPEHRALLRVPGRIPSSDSEKKEVYASSMISPPEETTEEMLVVSQSTPDLIPSAEDESVSDGFNDEIRHDLRDTVAPAAIFSLGSDEFTFSLDMTPAAQKLLDELPIYTPVKTAPGTNLPMFEQPPDSAWKTELLPVSKYASGRIKFHETEPPRKRSRYDYSQYDSNPEHGILDLPPEQTNVALFRPENKPIRDRIHPGHSFRPPTEYPMPSVGFFESRQSSQWTYAEDDELRRLVKEYSYNWSLISSCLTPSSQFTSGAERRTPWECFERWVGLEGLPADMSKTQYFRAYHQRIETAQRTVLAQQQAAQQQQQQQQQQQGGNNSTQAQQPIRRRTTQPVRVDRRRSSKHLALLDAMRKLAKKRETMLQKQQHASHLASLRKVNEANQPKPPISSPAEFSRLKYDRELKLQERQEQYRQQMIAQQRANLAAQRAGQIPNQQPMMNAPPGRTPSGIPHNPGTPGIPGATPNGMPNGMPNALPNGIPPGMGVSQGRPHMQGMPTGGPPMNGPIPPNPMAMKMMPQGGMPQGPAGRPGMPMQTSPDNTRVIREANRLQEQQRVLQSRQQPQPPQHQQPQAQQAQQQFHNQQQFGPQGSHSPNMNLPNVNGAPNNPAMMAALQAGSGLQSPSLHNSMPQGVSTPSPRMGQPNLLSGGVVPTISSIQNQIQRSNPNMTPEQVNKLATDRLHQYQQQRMSQVAMNAAAGNMASVQANYQVPHDGNFQSAQPGMNGGPGMQVPQSQGFSPMMRVPQPAQQNRIGVGNSPAMNAALPQQSRSATPQTQRSGSAQAGHAPGSGKSPHPPQAQIPSG
ncbi:MYB and HSA domain protein [Aspergillus udagawae]|uniref:Vacuolar import and degradation protein 21 n=1 Tax=Aspergillus udagawae TaxID=91492 RepID=A0A8E0UZ47_9EURO|nr:chromatin modification-protein VID21 [Aspergillus udagawae]GIC91167.1 chromatin modification-protein VID21 [Aspergillus udagawae]